MPYYHIIFTNIDIHQHCQNQYLLKESWSSCLKRISKYGPVYMLNREKNACNSILACVWKSVWLHYVGTHASIKFVCGRKRTSSLVDLCNSFSLSILSFKFWILWVKCFLVSCHQKNWAEIIRVKNWVLWRILHQLIFYDNGAS